MNAHNDQYRHRVEKLSDDDALLFTEAFITSLNSTPAVNDSDPDGTRRFLAEHISSLAKNDKKIACIRIVRYLSRRIWLTGAACCCLLLAIVLSLVLSLPPQSPKAKHIARVHDLISKMHKQVPKQQPLPSNELAVESPKPSNKLSEKDNPMIVESKTPCETYSLEECIAKLNIIEECLDGDPMMEGMDDSFTEGIMYVADSVQSIIVDVTAATSDLNGECLLCVIDTMYIELNHIAQMLTDSQDEYWEILSDETSHSLHEIFIN